MSGIRYRDLTNTFDLWTGGALTASTQATITGISGITTPDSGSTYNVIGAGNVGVPLVFFNKVINIGDGPSGTASGINTNANGAVIYYINCTIRINTVTTTSSNTSTQPFNNGGGTGSATNVTGAFRLGSKGGNNRPPDLATTSAASRGHFFIGCTIIDTSALASGTGTGRINCAFAHIEDTNIIIEGNANFRYYLNANPNYSLPDNTGVQPANTCAARFDNFILDNDRVAPNNFFNLGDVNLTLLSPNFVATSPFTNDGADITITAYASNPIFVDPGGTNRYYSIGNPSSNPHGIVSINPITRIPSGNYTTAVFYNGTSANVVRARTLEVTRYRPAFYNSFNQIAANGLPNFRIISTTDYSHGTAGDQYSLNTTPGTTITTTYDTVADGQLPVTSTQYNPFDGGTTTTRAQGLIYPTLVLTGAGTASSQVANNSTSIFRTVVPNVSYRSLFSFLNNNGFVQVSGGTSPRENFATRTLLSDVVETSVYAQNGNLRPTLLAIESSGATPAANITAYNNNVTADVTANGFRAQSSYEFNNLDWFNLLAGANYYTVSNGVLNGAINITTNATTNDFIGDVSIVGSLVAPLTTDIVTSYNSTGTLDWADSSQAFDGTFSTMTNVPTTTVTPPNTGRTADYTGVGTWSHDFNYSGTDTVYFIVDAQDGSNITLSNTGTGTVRVYGVTANDSNISTTSTSRVFLSGSNIEVEPTPALQPTRFNITIPANAIGLEYTLFRGATGGVQVEDDVLAADSLRFTSSTTETTVDGVTGFRNISNITDTFVVLITGTSVAPGFFSFTPTANTATVIQDEVVDSFSIPPLADQSAQVNTSAAVISAASTSQVSAQGTLNANRIQFEIDGSPTTGAQSESVMNYLFAHARSEAKFRTALRARFPEAINGFETRDVMQLLGQNAVNLRRDFYVLSDVDDAGDVQACAGVYDAMGANFDNANLSSLQSLTQAATGDPQVIAFPRLIGINRSDLDSSNSDQTTEVRAFIEQVYDIVKDTNRIQFRSSSSQNDNLQD